MYNNYFFILISIIIVFFIIDKVIDYINTLNWTEKMPKEVSWIYDKEKYIKSQKYEKAKFIFSNYSSSFSFIITLIVLIIGWFWYLDNFLRIYIQNELILSLSFLWIIFLISTIINIPFSYYQTFVIEENYWFNKMTKKLFFIDLIKSIILTLIVGWVLISLIVFIYLKTQNNFWWIVWIVLSLLSIFIMMFYSSLIVPIFNKQTPLEDWELKDAINSFAIKVWFKIDNIFVIDWSKRSSKANAYFSGFWSKKRIVLYDTLIKDLNLEELVAVLAHEIGHYKKKHTLQMLIFSIIQTWLIMFLFSLVINNLEIIKALWWNNISFHLWIIAFWILFTPLSFVLWIFGNILSRKNEYQADEFAKINYDSKYLINWLKKLSLNNLSNLLPHKIYEFVHYSHPSVLKRIQKLKI